MGIEGTCEVCCGFTRDYECIRCYRRKIEALEVHLELCKELLRPTFEDHGKQFGHETPNGCPCPWCEKARTVFASGKQDDGPEKCDRCGLPVESEAHRDECLNICLEHGTLRPCRHCLANQGR